MKINKLELDDIVKYGIGELRKRHATCDRIIENLCSSEFVGSVLHNGVTIAEFITFYKDMSISETVTKAQNIGQYFPNMVDRPVSRQKGKAEIPEPTHLSEKEIKTYLSYLNKEFGMFEKVSGIIIDGLVERVENLKKFYYIETFIDECESIFCSSGHHVVLDEIFKDAKKRDKLYRILDIIVEAEMAYMVVQLSMHMPTQFNKYSPINVDRNIFYYRKYMDAIVENKKLEAIGFPMIDFYIHDKRRDNETI